MSRKIHAAVTTAADRPPVIEALEIDEPGPGEVLVEIHASGICHTDFMAPRVVPLPAVFGHEGAGVVVAVGPGVTALAPGDRIVGSYGYCGHCARCAAGEMYHCDEFSSLQLGGRRGADTALRRPDGTPVQGSFFEQSSFATHAIMTERNAIPVEVDAPFEHLAPLACGVITGFGSVVHALAAQPGQSIVVFGAGGVGLAAIMGARHAGCERIVAVDLRERRLETARAMGATHTIRGDAEDVVAEVREALGGGADLSLETVGQERTFNNAIAVLRQGGRCGFVAVPNFGQPFSIEHGRALMALDVIGIKVGRSDPHRMIPRLAQLVATGQLPMQHYTSAFPFAQAAEALAAAEQGEVAKAVLVMP